jgi:ribosomal protein S12 methylthiotransferase
MYAHPAHISDALINVIAAEKKIVKYLDLPIQHCSDKILKLMGRRYERRSLVHLISKIRRIIPNIALRTSVIAGFPGEGKAEFAALLAFIKEVKFDRLGAFAYSREPGTPAYKMRGQVPDRIKQERVQQLMRAQARISRDLNQKMIGQLIEVLIEKRTAAGYVGRSPMDAPEIDGSVLVRSAKSLKPGEIVNVRVTGARTYDLFGCLT